MTELKKTRSEIKREAILTGALKAFQLYGVADTSMDKIAETANVSKRTVYNHFDSKEVLVTHIIKDIWSKTLVAYNVNYSPNKPLKEQFLELVLNEIAFSQNENFFELVRVAISHTLFSTDSFRADMRQFFEQETALIRWLKEANKDGKFVGMDAIKANEQIIGLIKGQAFWPQILRFNAPLTNEQCIELAEETVQLIMCRYLAK
ncbi:TetR/AcrR family transcriptional regulator [Psychrosphaera haliotis]|uniref:TetR/AcrR family transcriptional regulator n=1 Tax=Psychrosphaera haliotis TaxID=555083 RepID=UPI0031CE0903